MTHRESECRAKIAVPIVPVQTIAPETMSRDSVFERVTNDGAPVEDVAHEIPEIG
jgi:hypothetical protein